LSYNPLLREIRGVRGGSGECIYLRSVSATIVDFVRRWSVTPRPRVRNMVPPSVEYAKLVCAMRLQPIFLLVISSLLSLLGCRSGPNPQDNEQPSQQSATQVFDEYGGIQAQVSTRKGYFGVARARNRWVFFTPEGHAFWLLSVYSVNSSDGGSVYNDALQSKYGIVGGPFPWPTFVSQAVRRLRGWGFNALGEYTTLYALPVPTSASQIGNSEKIPFIRIIRPSAHCLTNKFGWAAGAVKDVVHGVTPSLYSGPRKSALPDIFDPNFAATAQGAASDVPTAGWCPEFPGGLVNIPWLVGTSSDDADDLLGFKNNVDPHIGWLVAVTAPTQSLNSNLGIGYSDTIVYSKLAWRDFLKQKYGTINLLNSAWGSTYSTFDSDGGWPSGKGLLDEGGGNSWMGADFVNLSKTAPQVATDLDAFLEIFAERYFSVMANAIGTASPDHLVFSPAALGTPRVGVLRAAARHIDVLQISIHQGELANLEGVVEQVYSVFGKPVILWTIFTAQADSPLASFPSIWGDKDNPTQELRGQAYANYVDRLLQFRASDGINPVVGIDWFAWTDKTVDSENANFGLVTNLDNAYDGEEDVRARGTDPWGYATGGEASDYGDFLSAVRQANQRILVQLRQELTY
jgi:hypothetical protein